MVTLSPETPGNETLRRRFRVHDERQLSARTTLLEADDTETGDPVRVELFDVGGADGADLTKGFRERLRARNSTTRSSLPSCPGGCARAPRTRSPNPTTVPGWTT